MTKRKKRTKCHRKISCLLVNFAGHQETVDEKPQGEKVTELDVLAFERAGVGDGVALVVTAVAGREEHRHVHDVRCRQLRGRRLHVLLLRRVRGEPAEREH